MFNPEEWPTEHTSEEKAEASKEAEKGFEEISETPIDENHSCVILEGPEYPEDDIPAGSPGEYHDLKLELRDKSGKVVRNLNEFLPPDSKIRVRYLPPKYGSYGMLSTNIPEGIVEVELKPGESLKDPRDIFGVCHEMSHLQQIQDPKYKEHVENEHRLRRIPSSKITEEQRLELTRSRAIVERDAWARALKMVRKMRQENGVDLLKSLGGWKECEKEIDDCLGSYERTAFRQSEGEIKNMFLKNKKYTEADLEQFKKTTSNPEI